jgi:Putative DNA-binding domain
VNSVFASALLDASQPTPKGVVNPDGSPASKRFAVYRNNVAVGLTDALELNFPVIRQLVGAEFFRAMAGAFLRQHPPQSPLMMFYGLAMPDFLAGFPPVAHLPYLPDMARLELAIRRAYHAADAAPIDAAKLGQLPPDDLMQRRVQIAPAVQILQSDWPIHAIWNANTDPTAARPIAGPQAVLITRPGFDPALHPLTPAAAHVVDLLLTGHCFATALDLAPPDLDFAGLLTLLLTQGAIVGLT